MSVVAEREPVSEANRGDTDMGSADLLPECDPLHGAPPRHIDLETALLDRYARSWIDLQQTRKAMAQRQMPDAIVSEFDRLEKRVSELLKRTLREHPLWSWLSQFPGLGGAHTALVIGRIGDPRRYPGQRCSEGHHLPPLYAVGAACPVAVFSAESDGSSGGGHSFAVDLVPEIEAAVGRDSSGADEAGPESERRHVCPGVMLEPRTTSGTRSLWHWAGLHADEEGWAPRKRKGFRVTYEPKVRASVMQPGGIAEQIVRLNVPVYAERYRQEKARLLLRVDWTAVIETGPGSQNGKGATERQCADGTVRGRPLRLYEADRIARKIAAKAFLADLLQEWKRLT